LVFGSFSIDESTSKVRWHKLDDRMSAQNELEADKHKRAVPDIWSGNL
jgi:hypothetical protein